MSSLATLGLFQRHRRPRVYIAGKIGKNDFRHDLLPALRGWQGEDGPLDCGDFSYVGPFFRSCDHGCRHGPGLHGVAGLGCDAEFITQRTVKNLNQAGLASADLVFAFIQSPDAYGSVWELGWAACAGIPTYLFFDPGVDAEEFWYASIGTVAPHPASLYVKDLPAVFRAVLTDWRRRQQ